MNPALRKQTWDIVRRALRCYAGILTENRAEKIKGYPRRFLEPTLYPSRMAAASRWPDLAGKDCPDKPWLSGFPRLIFVSDMGDALSRSITFESLLEEIILPIGSVHGTRHIWLWLTKRPVRMASFAKWLLDHGGEWPQNLVPMTSITSSKVLGRVEMLRKVPAAARGLSVEPLFEPVKLPLEGIDWVIVGGASGAGAEPFDIAWARDIQQRCAEEGVSFFCKQLGANAVDGGVPLNLRHTHGGDWFEWPEDLRVREVPEKFKLLVGN